MFDIDLSHVLGIALGYLIAQAIQWVRRILFWRVVERKARFSLASPDIPIDDAKQATFAALADVQNPQLEKVARSIQKTIPPIGKAPP